MCRIMCKSRDSGCLLILLFYFILNYMLNLKVMYLVSPICR